ncbi:hypothetical protein GCM10027586_04450 [Kineococcus gypseus]
MGNPPVMAPAVGKGALAAGSAALARGALDVVGAVPVGGVTPGGGAAVQLTHTALRRVARVSGPAARGRCRFTAEPAP